MAGRIRLLSSVVGDKRTSTPCRSPSRIKRRRKASCLILIASVAYCLLTTPIVALQMDKAICSLFSAPQRWEEEDCDILRFRGGGGDLSPNDDTYDDDGGDGGLFDEKEEEEAEAKPRLLSPTGLFRLYETAVAELLSSVEDVENEEKTKKQTAQSTAQNGRGGAFAAVGSSTPSSSTTSTRRRRWLYPLEASRVEVEDSETSSKKSKIDQRVVNGDSKKNDNKFYGVENISTTSENTENCTSNDGMIDLAKLWWVNVWTQQLPDIADNNQLSKENETTYASETTEVLETTPGKAREDHRLAKDDSEEVTSSVVSLEEAASEKPVSTDTQADASVQLEHSGYESSGLWVVIDNVMTVGFSNIHPSLRISRHLRPLRKATARATGLHGLLSGKPSSGMPVSVKTEDATEEDNVLDEEDLGMIRRRIAAIDRARQRVEAVDNSSRRKRRRKWFRAGRGRDELDGVVEGITVTASTIQNDTVGLDGEATTTTTTTIPEIIKVPPVAKKSAEELEEEQRRMERVKELDNLMNECQNRLQELKCEKDVLQRRPNPLWKYKEGHKMSDKIDRSTTSKKKNAGEEESSYAASRNFDFPPEDLVEEYLDLLISQGRLVKMNHTELWQQNAAANIEDDDDDETIGEDILSARSKEDVDGLSSRKRRTNFNGFWLLRQKIQGSSLGEKIGYTVETAVHKAVCAQVMGALARSISAIHGINIMTHTDIRLSKEQAPDLPPVGKGVIPGSSRDGNYARDAIAYAMRTGSRRYKKQRHKGHRFADEAFIQRDAVVETLLSHCQISAPLLKAFPLAWQRAMLGNIVTLVTAVVSDFCAGVQFEILGHRLSFSFAPISERDMMERLGMMGATRDGSAGVCTRTKREEFEAAIRATAEDLAEKLKFLDRWHHRALGGGMVRWQVANLIARVVLSLAEEILGGAQMDLWSAQAGGPRMVAGLEFRTKTPTAVADSNNIAADAAASAAN